MARTAPLLRPLILVPTIAACAAACTRGPMSILDPAGPTAAPVTRVWWVMFWVGLGVLAFMTALGLYTARRRGGGGRGASMLLLVGGGVVLPLAAIVGLLAFGLSGGRSLLPTSTDRAAFRVEVVAHQWWWEIAYPDAPQGTLYSANHLRIPAGVPVHVHVRTDDVIHSFWIPRLGGKIDAIPGRTNVIRIEAQAPGRHRGQCAEYCGLQHAQMAFEVDVLPSAAMQRALAELAAPRARVASASAERVFAQQCRECHALDATERSSLAPNLADFAARPTIGAGALPNTEEALRAWLIGHQEVKPGNRMAVQTFTVEELDALVAWLRGSS